MRVLLAAVIAGLWQSFRETLPSTEDEAGAFLSGLVYAFVIHWLLLILVTVVYCKVAGVPL